MKHATSILVAAVLLMACASQPVRRPIADASTSPWYPTAELTSAGVTHQNVAASGSTVHLALGDGVIRYRQSPDEGASWRPWIDLGQGVLYLDDPIVADGGSVGVIGVDGSSTVTDFFGQREVGDLFLYLSTDSGNHWQRRRKLTHGAAAFRVSLAINGRTVHVAWMDYRRGSWDIRYLRSQDLGETWTQEIVIAAGTNAVGAERPAIAADGDDVHLVWMDARDEEGPCVIERGTTLSHCTQIYYARSVDGGANWQPSTRLTDNAGYSGRPHVRATSGTVLVAFDRRLPRMAQNVAIMRSGDRGGSWTRETVAAGPAEQTHARLAGGEHRFFLAWMSLEGGEYQLRFSASPDGRIWTTPELVPSSGGTSAPGLALSAQHALVTWSAPVLRVARRRLAIP